MDTQFFAGIAVAVFAVLGTYASWDGNQIVVDEQTPFIVSATSTDYRQ